MATADDRRALTAQPARRWRTTWLGIVGTGLALALLAAALVQGRQAALLNQSVQYDDDYVVLTVYQTEIEYLRLLHEWHVAQRADPPDVTSLQLRYDIWVSRVGLLRHGRADRALQSQAGFQQTLAALDAFIARADTLLGAQAGMPLSTAALRALEPDLAGLSQRLHDLSLSAAHHVGDQLATRNQAVRQHNQVGIALTVSLCALTLVFALLALRQMRQLEQRHDALEELAASLRVARREAESASEAKSVFLANMSHEIRTPFHGLMGMLSLLRETGLAPRQIDYLRTATESADHLLALLNDILDMSQLESGRMALAPAQLDLRLLLRDVEALMRQQASAKQLALHIDADPAVPDRMLADARRVKQVLFNLLSNAIKFSDHGSVVLDVRQRGALLDFVVTDTGIGMDDATQASLFKRFVQGDASPSRRHGGSGLGLEISRNLARLMGGDVSASSRLGVGSTFTFSLPLQVVPAEAPPEPQAGADPAAPQRPLRVLVAEDHPVNRQYMAALLESMGHEAHFTANGQEALDAVRDRPRSLPAFDVVLMDLHMPQLDGIAATRAIRALPDTAAATLPIVALTADAFNETRDRCLVAGMNDFLTKPISPQQLSASLRRLFGSGGDSQGDALPVAPRPDAVIGQPPLLDLAALAMARQAMAPERLAALVHGFLDQGPHTAERLRAAVRDAQPLDLRVNAHAARGAALNLGLAAIAATAESLHEGASHLPAHEIARHVQRFEDLIPPTRDAVVAAGLRRPASQPA